MDIVTDVKSVIRAGIKIFISLKSSAATQKMQSSIVAVGDDSFGIEVPMKDGYYHPLQKDTEVEVSFFAGSGKYFFECAVKGRIIYNKIPVILLSLPSQMERTERREYYRIETLFPVKVIITQLVGEGDNQRVVSEEYKAHCVDISGGGMQLDAVHSKKIPIKQDMILDIDFSEALEGISRAKGVAIRRPFNENTGWGIKFTKIQASDRDKIIRYVFKKQRELKNTKE